ncbi:lysylphosphatidylglycerol synthase transmembrane domain-containing protein [Leadbetterella byssophila]|uniref:Integral membrane protein n=1 Tax=Leadbetterella byssophila (strain DSM 17132 / JCM 16389 / KACC 11308 / NBRC 106382 / 4M15) TaxID=649349 RepID=E4RTN7_LEAB4|nr:lysylphosphatidylglycerol synthase transmembrane domain-containing protein [Leadbetterella byssophila]ADQ16894.1 integral membrane protein [Leadbetterella byssophila DSM 17132]
MIKKWISYLVPLVLGLALLNWVFNEIDLSKTLEDFKSAKLSWVILGAFLALISHILRAARWGLMLESMGYKPSVYKTTLAVLIGYLTNLVFPRAGEVARAVSLQKTTDIPFDKSFGAVIAERVTDVLVLLVLVGVNLLLEFDRIYGLFVELAPDVRIIGAVIGMGVVGLLLLFFFRYKIKSTKIYQKFGGIFKGLKEGIMSVVHLNNPWKFVGQSFLIWVLYYFSSMVLCKAIFIGADLSSLAILTILVMGTIGMAIPTVGGIGSYHLLVGKIVTLYGLSQQDGVSLATFLHSLNGILFVLLFGFVALVLNTFTGQKR